MDSEAIGGEARDDGIREKINSMWQFDIMLHCLYGIDTYRSRKRLDELMMRHRQETGSGRDTHRFDASESDASHLKAAMDMSSLFSSAKRLVLVMHAFSSTGDTAEMVLARGRGLIAGEDVFVLWDGEVGAEQKKRIRSFAALGAVVEEFSALSGNDLVQWIRGEAKARGIGVRHDTVARLETLADSWAITNELEKMVVTDMREDKDGFVINRPASVFELGAALLQPPARGLGLLRRLLDQGEDDFRLFSYIAGYVRTLLAVKVCGEEQKAVPKTLGIHPFAAKKAAEKTRMVPRERIVSLVRRMLEEDMRIKTGLSTPRESLERIFVS